MSEFLDLAVRDKVIKDMSETRRPTLEELEKILASNEEATIHINPDGSVFVNQELDRLRADNARLVGEVESLKTKLGEYNAGYPTNSQIAQAGLAADIQFHKEALEKAKAALDRVWEVEEMGYTPDDPESESGVCVCDKCEGVQHPNIKSHSENCPQPIIEEALAAINKVLGGEG